MQERRKEATGLPLPKAAPAPSVTRASRGTTGAGRSRAVPTARRRGLTVGGLAIVVLTLVAFGTGRFLGAGQALPTPTPFPTPTARARVIALASPAIPSPPPSTPTPRVVRTPEAPKFNSHDGRRVVCLDPGHGGADTGYTRKDDGTVGAMTEKELNLRYAWDLESRLQADGIRVVMTRNDDVAVNRSGVDVNGDGQTGPLGTTAGDLDELQARINLCNRANADLLVSMHINGFPTQAPSGFEVWFTGARPFADQSRYFAELMDDELARQMDKAGYDPPNRGVHDDINANVDNGPDTFNAKHYVILGPEITQGGKTLIKPSLMPGTIVEPGFISNDADAAFLLSSEGENAIVTAYEQAILQYFKKYPG